MRCADPTFVVPWKGDFEDMTDDDVLQLVPRPASAGAVHMPFSRLLAVFALIAFPPGDIQHSLRPL